MKERRKERRKKTEQKGVKDEMNERRKGKRR